MEHAKRDAGPITERTVVETGYYRMVSLVKGNVTTPAERRVKETSYGGLGGAIARVLGGKKTVRQEAFDVVAFAYHIAGVHQVGQEDIKSLPQGLTDIDQVRLANVVAAISQQHDSIQNFLLQQSGERPSYTLGLLLADFLDVIPNPIAARLVFACANPDVARTIQQGEGTLNISNVDVQSLIIEGLILTSPQTRREIFTELVKLQPGQNGRASRFLSLMASEWTNRNSNYCGLTMIYRNLEDQLASLKVLEVQAEFLDLRRIVNEGQ